MTVRRYCIVCVPVEHRVAANILLAVIAGDDTSVSNSFSRGASPDGSWTDFEDPYATATHFFGGTPINENVYELAWYDAVNGIIENLPTPPGGWPYNGVTEAQALAAAQAIKLQTTTTFDGSEPSSEGTLAAALASYSPPLIAIEPS